LAGVRERAGLLQGEEGVPDENVLQIVVSIGEPFECLRQHNGDVVVGKGEDAAHQGRCTRGVGEESADDDPISVGN
jgi:hypothetical protein